MPTAEFQVFHDPRAAEDHIRGQSSPVVVKASGLAAGKGAIVCEAPERALRAVREMMEELRFGEAGREVVIEECMRGEELSVFALTDGQDLLTLLPSQDHKRVGEGDTGPNTGGMGAYAPVSLVTPSLVKEVEETILRPTLRALEADDSPFQGLLYAGIMLTSEGPKVVEFNCRFGDPETQAILPLLSNSLLEPIAAIAEGGSVRDLQLQWRPGGAVNTVLASQGYPGSYEKGKPIQIPDDLAKDPDILLFHAGTSRSGEELVTSGGRVLSVTGMGENLGEASRKSLVGADAVGFEGKYFRTDIGWREFARDESQRP